jgi:hypothetical protein
MDFAFRLFAALQKRAAKPLAHGVPAAQDARRRRIGVVFVARE